MSTKNKDKEKKIPDNYEPMEDKKPPEDPEPIKQIPPKKKAGASKQRLIYCGPNVTGGGLQQFMVFKGGCPEHLKKHLQACPAIQKLCVPISDFTKTRKDIITPGTAANQYYQEVLRYSAELKEGK
ncbi:MAG TPA: hypothetical protein PLM20_07580 [Syntrophomonadaceae bacterium]|jgi:hypothetical protein|nr:hypothetical protein [Syntrophomonadaceae bacterium]HQE23743.1 hypothetical protein [Syntrophomonadaceae bacterium]